MMTPMQESLITCGAHTKGVKEWLGSLDLEQLVLRTWVFKSGVHLTSILQVCSLQRKRTTLLTQILQQKDAQQKQNLKRQQKQRTTESSEDTKLQIQLKRTKPKKKEKKRQNR